ncbi:hypothetical protein NQ317_005970 [Molorchus minor]|uniref:Nuclease HARBI1 n=1 Tax=Molorchus minor TaxID=1323400 RepID=A0ABQ9IXX1_9CUCU|nr:hypothetical protein NQ317_005970 [Molorchus minor]
MYRGTFDHVLSLIEGQIASDVIDKGRHTISAKSQFLITLWYFGTPDSFRSVCGIFNIGPVTALRAVRRVTNALFALSKDIIGLMGNTSKRLHLNLAMPDFLM